MDELHIASLLDAYAAQYPPFLNARDAAALADIPLGTLYNWSSQGKLDNFMSKRGRCLRFCRDAFVRYLATK